MSAHASPGPRILLDTPAVQLVLDAAGAVSMFVVVEAIAGSRDAALVTAALTAVVLSSRLRRRISTNLDEPVTGGPGN